MCAGECKISFETEIFKILRFPSTITLEINLLKWGDVRYGGGGAGLINKFCGCVVRDLVRFNMGKCKKNV